MQTKTSKQNQFENSILSTLRDMFEELKNDLLEELKADFQPSYLEKDRLLKPSEAAQILGISQRTLKRYRDDNKIPFVKRGNLILYYEKSLNSLNKEEYSGEPTIYEEPIKRKGRPSKFSL